MKKLNQWDVILSFVFLLYPCVGTSKALASPETQAEAITHELTPLNHDPNDCQKRLKQKIQFFNLPFEASSLSVLSDEADTNNKKIDTHAFSFDPTTFLVENHHKKNFKLSTHRKTKTQTGWLHETADLIIHHNNDTQSLTYELDHTVSEIEINPFSGKSFSERWSVNKACEIKLTYIESSDFYLTKEQGIKKSRKSYLENQAGAEEEKTETCPFLPETLETIGLNGYNLTSLIKHFITLGKKEDIFYSYNGNVTITSDPIEKNIAHPITNEPLKGKEISATITSYDQKIPLHGWISDDFSCLYSTELKTEIWNLPEKEWQKIEPVFLPELRSSYRLLLPQETPTWMTLVSSQEIKYPHIASYWEIVDHQLVDEEEKIAPLRMIYNIKPINYFPSEKELSDDLIGDMPIKNLPFELSESEMVQISHPKVQALIAQLLPYQKTITRLEMAEKVRKLVNETLTYDHLSLANNKIYALKTEDILERKKGVCQHFANLYAALARGVGIPTRIIVGYAMDTPHAWNEIEIRTGVWRPIEPNAHDLSFLSFQYFPILIGLELDTKQAFKSHEYLQQKDYFESLQYQLFFSLKPLKQ